MNKLSIRKPLALLLTVVMLMSSTLVYMPAFAADPIMYEGQERYSDFAPLSTQKLLLEDEVFSGHWCNSYYWENNNYLEISTTRFLPARSEAYVILVVNDGDNDGDYFKEKTVNLSVKSNREPITDDELNIAVDEGKSVVIEVLVGDSDPDGDEIDLVSVSPTDTGFEVDGTVVKFTAPDAMDADAEFTAVYTIKDDNVHGSLTATGTIKVQVTEVDDPTIYNDLGVKTSENTSEDFDPLFEVDDEDDTVTVDTVNFSQPDNGTVTYSNSEWTYDPNTDYSGTDTFIVYLLVNGESLPRTVNVEVEDDGVVETNQAPVTDDELNIPVNEGESVAINVLDGDSDPDGDSISLVSVSPTNTGFEVVGTVVVYTAPDAMSADDTFTAEYTIEDDNVLGSLTATGTITVVVSEVEDPTIFEDLIVKTSEDNPKDFDPLFEATDEDDVVEVDEVNFSQPDNGTVTCVNSVWTYTPDTGYSGTDTFIVNLIVDSVSLPRTVNVKVTDDGVVEINQAPVTDDELNIPVNEGESVAINVLDGDSDPDGDSISLVSVSPTNTGFEVVGTVVVYTAPDAMSADDTFTAEYTIEDDNVLGSLTATGTITVVVSEVEDPTIFEDLIVKTSEDNPKDFDPLFEATDEDDVVEVDEVNFSQPDNGTVTCVNSVWTYTPDTGYSGTDTFIVNLIVDSVSLPRTVNVKVTDDGVVENLPPTNGILQISTSENAALSFNPLLGVTDPNDVDAVITFGTIGPVVNGTATIDPDDDTRILYTPKQDWVDVEEFTIEVTSEGQTVIRKIRISVTENDPNNDAPIFNSNTFSVDEGQVDKAFDWTNYVSDSDGPNPLSLVGTIVPSVGNIEAGGPTGFYYTHDGSNPNPDGIDGTLTFTVTDGINNVTGNVELIVTPKLDLLLAYDDTIIATEGLTVSHNVVANDVVEIVEPDGLPTISIVQNGEHGTAVPSDYYITYTPVDGYVGTDTVEYMITDSQGETDTAILTIDVRLSPWNYNYVGWDYVKNVNQGTTKVHELLHNDSYSDQIYNVFLDSQPKKGTATIVYDSFLNKAYLNYTAFNTSTGKDYIWYRTELVNGIVRYGRIKVDLDKTDQITLMDDVRTVWEDSSENKFPIVDNDLIEKGIKRIELWRPGVTEDGPYNGSVRIEWVNDIYQAIYTPDPGFNGTDTFRYVVWDTQNYGDIASVIVKVVPDNIAYDPLAPVTRGTMVNIPLTEDVSKLGLPSGFDPDSLEVQADFYKNDENDLDPSAGIITTSGANVTYDPNDDLQNVRIVFTVNDDFGHEVSGEIYVNVYPYSTDTGIRIEESNPIRINQYSGLDDARAGVTYMPSIDLNGVPYGIEYKYEKVNPTDSEDYYYNFNAFTNDSYNQPASVVNFFGNFDLTYYFKDTSGQAEVSVASKDVYVNGQPLLSFNELPNHDPVYILPDGHSIMTTSTTKTSVFYGQTLYGESYDVLNRLYGFDWENYRTNGKVTLANSELPDNVVLKYYLEGDDVGRVFDNFWDDLTVGRLTSNTGDTEAYVVPTGAEGTYRDSEGVYTLYKVQFTLTDAERIACPDGFESPKSEMLELKVYNNAPVLTGVEDFQVYEVGTIEEPGFDPKTGVDVIDPEDEKYLGDHELLRDRISFAIEDMNYVPDSSDPDDSALVAPEVVGTTEGSYRVTYTYTDLHGITVIEHSIIWVVGKSAINVMEPNLEIENGGYFPTFMGVTSTFWDAPTLPPSGGTTEPLEIPNGMVREYVEARLGSEVIGRFNVTGYNLEDMDEVYRFNLPNLNPDQKQVIEYFAIQEISDDDVWVIVTSLPAVRNLNVTEADFGDYFFTSDMGEYFRMAEGASLEGATSDEEPDFKGRQFPVVAKYKFVPGEDGEVLQGRIFTTILEVAIPDDSNSPIDGGLVEELALAQSGMQYHYFVFLDLAETSDGQVYGLSSDQKIWQFDSISGGFKEIVDLDTIGNDSVLNDEIRAMFAEEIRNDIEIEILPVLSLTGDKDDNLVFMVSVHTKLSDDFNDMYNVIVVMQPDGTMLSYDLTDSEYPYINDVAYDEELVVLYALGSYEYTGDQAESLSLEGMDGYYDQDLFKLVMNELEEGGIAGESLSELLHEERYTSTVLNELPNGDHYSGLAVVNDEIMLTKLPLEAAMNMNTFVDVLGLDGQLITSNYEIAGMFSWAFGAASTFTKETTLDANPTSIISGGSSTITLTVSPVKAFSGTPLWSENRAGELVNPPAPTANAIDENGNMTMVYNSVSGIAETVTITVTVDGITSTTSIIVRNDDGDDDDDDDNDSGGTSTPRVATASIPKIGVKLDTDAITLDYGETADPEFTSYDFTETVTGTDDKDVSWSLSDDSYVTVDNNGVVTAKSGVPVDTGDFTVILTVKTDDGGATATATILFEEQTPLGAIEFFEPYISGYSDGSFRPSNQVTRAEVASMFARILKLNMVTSGSQKFSDVPSDYWAYGSIQAMYRSGLFSGYLDKDGIRYFDPEEAISRAEIAQVFTNYWNFLEISVTGENLTPIPDVPSDYWASPAINRIFNTGIFTGFDDGTFKPDDSTLREQIVSMINRLIARPANEAETSKFTDILPTHKHFGDIEAASQTFLKSQGE